MSDTNLDNQVFSMLATLVEWGSLTGQYGPVWDEAQRIGHLARDEGRERLFYLKDVIKT